MLHRKPATITLPPPTLPLLERLVPGGSLKQKAVLCKSIRLWVTLRTLYCKLPSALALPFTYAEWHSIAIDGPGLLGDHSADTPQSIPANYWLFEIGQAETLSWQQAYCQKFNLAESEVKQRLDRLQPFARGKSTSEKFYIRKMRNDLYKLIELNCLEEETLSYHERMLRRTKGRGTAYQLCQHLPDRITDLSDLNSIPNESLISTDSLHSVDLAEIFISYHVPINGVQRFFLDLEYVVSWQRGDWVSQWQTILREKVWSQPPVPPVLLHYNSASQGNSDFRGTVYPVCIYYSRRALYLCAYGETPVGANKAMGWYNFRLDRVTKLDVLHWNNPDSKPAQIPPSLLTLHRQHKLPQPEYIQEQMENAWGFDFYQTAQPLLLRFERVFHDAYIQESERHPTFLPIDLNAPRKLSQFLGQFDLPPTELQRIQRRMEADPNDAYYRALYRPHDNNLIMRLRAWGSKVEVLLPLTLRERMRLDASATCLLYEENPHGLC
ncbi:MAG: TIGR03985 family CRISPR-associated protein [Acaryochloris sp. RU_4_1]|nr:TIGR03985 family CRISPR-associated protein [Acaryochloris sp. RU_4_1]